jgi:capsular exopolysaccharide synthesis family protein
MRNEEDQSNLPAIPAWRDQQLGYPAQTFDDPYGPRRTYAEELGSRTVSDYLQAFVQRKWLVLAFLAGGFAIGLAVMVPTPLTYPAEVSLEIQGLNESFMNLNQVDPQASAGIYSASSANINTQVEILNSSSLRQRVAERLERETIPTLPPAGSGLAGAFNVIRSAVRLSPASPVDALREAIRTAVGTTRARPQEGTRIVRIECQSTSPEVASEFLNVLVTEYTEQSLENRVKSSKTTNQWLDSQMHEQKQKLEEAETKLKDFVAKAGVQGLTQHEQGVTLADTKLAQLQQELSAIQADRIVRQSRYEAVLKNGAEKLPDGMAGSSLLQYRSSLADLEKQLAELNTTFTSNHPKVRRVQAQINEVQKSIDQEKAEVIERLRNDLEAAKRREQLLTSSFSTQTGAVQSQSDKTLQFNLLKRDVESNRTIYNNILQQTNQAGIATAVPTNTVRVVDAATPTMIPSLRTVYIGGGLGLMTGLLLGCVLAVVLHHSEMRFYKPGEVLSVLNLPELGVIPSGEIFEEKRGLRRFVAKAQLSRRQKPDLQGSLQDGPGDPIPLQVELITHEHKPSLMAESFRAVLTSILFAPNSENCKVIAVTSPNPQDGKSTVVSNLAIALAEMGRKVLLVDADLRKPKLHVVFNMENTWGLGDILEDKAEVENYPRAAFVRETSIPGLCLLPSGPPLRSIASNIHSERFKEVLARLRREFEYVFVDTPPVLLVPDARVIGQRSDGVILVLRSAQTLHLDALSVVRRLKEDGTQLLGTILNQWVPPGIGSQRYKKYYEYYRHPSA